LKGLLPKPDEMAYATKRLSRSCRGTEFWRLAPAAAGFGCMPPKVPCGCRGFRPSWPICTPAGTRRTVAAIGNAGVITMERLGHFPMSESHGQLRRHIAPVPGDIFQ
jgi:hypothetical protein